MHSAVRSSSRWKMPPTLRPGPGQVLVDVEAAGVNYIDVYQQRGLGDLALPLGG